ncbi:cryptochrome/photolyase family protein [Kribbella sp. NPDC003505]|uniref:cryptochrome/photolyase family protein n=1 Tax=Kribbella sp. NPDC003505 TaxID=3154448 RepID=UPI0033BBC036
MGPRSRATGDLGRRWLFADQLGPHFLDTPQQPVLMIESRHAFARRRFHRQKAHLVLSALRHRAAELDRQATFIQADTYAAALAQVGEPLTICGPTTHAAERFVQRQESVTVLPARGFVTSREDFAHWAANRGRRRLLLEDFYRDVRVRREILMDGGTPAGGRWNFDHDNRKPPPRGSSGLGAPAPWWPEEDAIDAEVRQDLDRWERDGSLRSVGSDGPRRFAVTRDEAVSALEHFVEHRLPAFGAHEDAMLAGDDWMAHSLLSVPLNLGLLDPLEVVEAAEASYRSGHAPIAAVEGFVRQIIGWRDWTWHLYWHFDRDYRERNALRAHRDVPNWFQDLDAEGNVRARCLSETLRGVRENGWAHHIQRLMVLGNYALQRGWRPDQLTDWFHRSFVDGYDWVMVTNVVGMSQHADGGLLATKPYAAGGSYLNKMSDYCGSCVYDPKVRVGPDACPFTAGYWWFLSRNQERLRHNHRLARPLKQLETLDGIEEVVLQEDDRGSRAP